MTAADRELVVADPHGATAGVESDLVDVAGVPLPWVLLGVVVHPALIGGGLLYVRQAERNEHDFAEVVERS